MDLRTASRLFFIAALMAGAWFLVKHLKPREADLQAINSRDGQLGDMTPSAVRHQEGGPAADDVSSLDMLPTSSLPLAGPGGQEPATEPVGVPLNAVPPPAPEEPAPAPPAPRPAPAKKPRVRPQFQPQENPLGKSAATSAAFLAAPEDKKKSDPKKPPK